jgi:cathepsin X
MIDEIYNRGPISCGIYAYQAFDDYTGGVFCETPVGGLNHAISIVGYGTDTASGQDYWLVRNSWGTAWGEDGFAKVCRNVNSMGIETDCTWAMPVDTWTTQERH